MQAAPNSAAIAELLTPEQRTAIKMGAFYAEAARNNYNREADNYLKENPEATEEGMLPTVCRNAADLANTQAAELYALLGGDRE